MKLPSSGNKHLLWLVLVIFGVGSCDSKKEYITHYILLCKIVMVFVAVFPVISLFCLATFFFQLDLKWLESHMKQNIVTHCFFLSWPQRWCLLFRRHFGGLTSAVINLQANFHARLFAQTLPEFMANKSTRRSSSHTSSWTLTRNWPSTVHRLDCTLQRQTGGWRHTSCLHLLRRARRVFWWEVMPAGSLTGVQGKKHLSG